MNIDESIVDSHMQKENYSCIPSAVELVLKLLGLVSVDYYDLQNEWGNKNDGSFACFHNKCIAGVTFTRVPPPPQPPLPARDLFDFIDRELAADRYVIISLETRGGWHMCVIYANQSNEYQAVTKDAATKYINDVKLQVQRMQSNTTDILIYRL